MPTLHPATSNTSVVEKEIWAHFGQEKLVAVVPFQGVYCGNVATFKAVVVPQGGATNQIVLFLTLDDGAQLLKTFQNYFSPELVPVTLAVVCLPQGGDKEKN